MPVLCFFVAGTRVIPGMVVYFILRLRRPSFPSAERHGARGGSWTWVHAELACAWRNASRIAAVGSRASRPQRACTRSGGRGGAGVAGVLQVRFLPLHPGAVLP